MRKETRNKKRENAILVLILFLGVACAFAIINTQKDLTGSAVLNTPESGLVGYYNFDGNANNFVDKYNGKVFGGVTFPNGKSEKSARFHRLNNNEYISIDGGTTFSPISAITISTWIKIESSDKYNFLNNSGEVMGIVGKSNWEKTGNSINGYELKFSPKNSLQFVVGDKDSYGQASYSKTNFKNNQWYYLTGTYDGSKIRLYVDGKEVGEQNYSSGFGASSSQFVVGKAQVNGPGYFNGLIDELRIYNRALNESEIKTLGGVGNLPVINQTCIDSDGGIEPLEKGDVTSSIGLKKDSCISNKEVNEFYCDDNGVVSEIAIQCPDRCENGKCFFPPACSETDGGKDYSKKGTVNVGENSAEDFCSDNEIIREYFCVENGFSSEQKKCQHGCEAGICKKQSASVGETANIGNEFLCVSDNDCETGFCKEGKCISVDELLNSLGFFKRIQAFFSCRGLDTSEYNSCVYDFVSGLK